MRSTAAPTALAGQQINLEFVSANPTGPVHIGGVRWAAVGDALARLLRAAGAEVGHRVLLQRRRLADRPVRRGRCCAAARGEPVPEDGYGGAYIDDIAAAVVGAGARRARSRRGRAVEVFRVEGVKLMFAEIKASLARASASTSTSTSTRRTCTTAASCSTALDRLREQGHVYEADGAVWLRTTEFGDDKDRVLRKSDGDWTYFAADCAYYLDKRERGFDRS